MRQTQITVTVTESGEGGIEITANPVSMDRCICGNLPSEIYRMLIGREFSEEKTARIEYISGLGARMKVVLEEDSPEVLRMTLTPMNGAASGQEVARIKTILEEVIARSGLP